MNPEHIGDGSNVSFSAETLQYKQFGQFTYVII